MVFYRQTNIGFSCKWSNHPVQGFSVCRRITLEKIRAFENIMVNSMAYLLQHECKNVNVCTCWMSERPNFGTISLSLSPSTSSPSSARLKAIWRTLVVGSPFCRRFTLPSSSPIFGRDLLPTLSEPIQEYPLNQGLPPSFEGLVVGQDPRNQWPTLSSHSHVLVAQWSSVEKKLVVGHMLHSPKYRDSLNPDLHFVQVVTLSLSLSLLWKNIQVSHSNLQPWHSPCHRKHGYPLTPTVPIWISG